MAGSLPDIGPAFATLGQSTAGWGKVWNVPTVAAMASQFITSILRLFIPELAEMKELKYQLVQDYMPDSTAFEEAFSFSPTPMETSLKEVLENIKAGM